MFGALTSALARECRSVATGRMAGALFAGEGNGWLRIRCKKTMVCLSSVFTSAERFLSTAVLLNAGRQRAYLPVGAGTYARRLDDRESVTAVRSAENGNAESWRRIQRSIGARSSFWWSNRALHLAHEGVLSYVQIYSDSLFLV